MKRYIRTNGLDGGRCACETVYRMNRIIIIRLMEEKVKKDIRIIALTLKGKMCSTIIR